MSASASALVVCLGFVTGFWGLRDALHRTPYRKAIGFALALIGVVLGPLFALFVAHFREAADYARSNEVIASIPLSAVLDRMTQGLFSIYTLPSFSLLGSSLVAFLVGLFEGYQGLVDPDIELAKRWALAQGAQQRYAELTAAKARGDGALLRAAVEQLQSAHKHLTAAVDHVREADQRGRTMEDRNRRTTDRPLGHAGAQPHPRFLRRGSTVCAFADRAAYLVRSCWRCSTSERGPVTHCAEPNRVHAARWRTDPRLSRAAQTQSPLGARTVVAGATAAFAVFVLYFLNPLRARVEVDATYCLTTLPAPASTIFLVDASDPNSRLRSAQITGDVVRHLSDARLHERIIVTGVAGYTGQSAFSACAPSNPASVNALTQNRALASREWRLRLMEPATSATRELLEAPPEGHTPLIETIVAQASDLGFRAIEGERRIVVYSDGIQNSPGLNFYGTEDLWQAYLASNLSSAPPDLNGVTIEFNHMATPAGQFSPEELRAFWTRYVTSAGGRITWR